ncbi:MAG: UvrD-helicase domain-containing protein [candidate division WOR-3 bacterium]
MVSKKESKDFIVGLKSTIRFDMDFENSILKDLNDKQKEAVLYLDSPLLILAGAGSGKTRVLTYKIFYLIKNNLSYPGNIFAVTFTNKAADEMKERVEKLLGYPVRNMMIGTFHSMCVRIIKMFRMERMKNPDFTIYDVDDSRMVIKNILKEKKEEDLDPRSVQKLISAFKNRMILPDDLDTDEEQQAKLKDIYSEYQHILRKNNAFDFDDLLVETLNIFNENENFKRKFSEKIKFILVDEYQDTNYAQFLILKNIFNGNNHITVVGDDDQSIYGFRGAELKNILEFEKYFPDTKIIKLEQNYRSTKNILNVANRVIKNNLKRKDKVLWSSFEDGERVKIVKCRDERDEAIFVVDKILEIKNGTDKKFKDFAILYRTNAQSRPFEEILRKNNIRYTLIGNIRFFERKEIKDLLSYLSFTVNKNDEISLKRIINFPKRGIGDVTLKHITDTSKSKNISLWESLKEFQRETSTTKKSKTNIKEFLDLIETVEKNKDNVYNALEILVDSIDFETVFEKMDKNEKYSRLENIQELLNSAKEFVLKNEDKSISSYLDMISLYTDIDEYKDDDAILLMTVHNAKGLEFETVFITGLEEELFPHRNSFEDDFNCEEERRLLYVALTRAKKDLYITYAAERFYYGESSLRFPSRFLNEIGFQNDLISFYDRTTSGSRFEKEYISKNAGNMKIEKSRFNINERVFHPIFGEGIIKGKKGSGEDEILIIQFLNGDIKKIFAEYANLTRK